MGWPSWDANEKDINLTPIMPQETSCYVSVIIPTRDRASILPHCLQAVFQQAIGRNSYEIIVVDDGSRDSTPDFLASGNFPDAFRYILQWNRGAAAARNAGAKLASGQILLFLDDDIVAGPGLIAAHCAMHQRCPDSIVIGQVEVLAAGFDSAVEKTFREVGARGIARVPPGGDLTAADLLTGNCSMGRKQFLDLGGFDEVLLSNEDFEFGLRALKCGYRIRYCPAARAQELYCRGVELFLEDAWRRGYAHGAIAIRHPNSAYLLPLTRFFDGPFHRRLARRFAWTCAAGLSIIGAGSALRGKTCEWLVRNVVLARRVIAAVNYWGGVREAVGSTRALHGFK